MIIVVDVGNTNIVFGAYDAGELVNSWRMATQASNTSDEYAVFIKNVITAAGYDESDVAECIISSVVPDIMHSLVNTFKKYYSIDPVVVTNKMNMGITLDGNISANEIGADRIVNCEAAWRIYGGPAIVIDYGTANTFDYIDERGRFVTGITAPGIRICAEALFSRAALLGKVEIIQPESIHVTNTVESVQAGIVYGKIGETEYIVTALKKHFNVPDCRVVGTGGMARVISSGTDIIDTVDPTLTLEGLRILYEQNKP